MPRIEKPRHTPGPWFVGEEHTDFGGRGPSWLGIGNGSAAIAHSLKTGLIDAEKARANARLIASGPDLLALLQLEQDYYIGEEWAIEEVDRLVADGQHGKNPDGVFYSLRRDVIAKTEA